MESTRAAPAWEVAVFVVILFLAPFVGSLLVG